MEDSSFMSQQHYGLSVPSRVAANGDLHSSDPHSRKNVGASQVPILRRGENPA
jgi:hypothetical protein